MVVTRCEETVKGNKCFHTLSCLLYICDASNISLSTVSSFTGLLNAARSQAVNVRACVCVCVERERLLPGPITRSLVGLGVGWGTSAGPTDEVS